MPKYQAWIVGRRDTVPLELVASAGEVRRMAASRLGVAADAVGVRRLKPERRDAGYQVLAWADYQILNGMRVKAGLYRFVARNKRGPRGKRLARHRWITDWGERIGQVYDNWADAVDYAVWRGRFSNIKIIADGSLTDRITARVLRNKHGFRMTE